MIALIDYGAGNVRSVHKALETVGARVRVTSDPEDVLAAGRIVLPGVGAFGDCMAGLRRAGLVDGLRQAVERGVPLLGICVGMQVLFEEGEEMGRHAGLGFLPGRVVRFSFSDHPAGERPTLKIPHTGWNQIEPVRTSPLLHGLRQAWTYFNHAYYCQALPEHVLAVTGYGGPFPSIVGRGPVFGIQFHPEKSQEVGLHILKNFVERVGRGERGERREWTVYPAIDLRRGRVVRLRQGDPGRETTYADDPLSVARRWQEAGATWLHVVNLDGAFDERGQENQAALERILTTGLRIQFGGGVRDFATLRRALDLGASRVVIGTAAVKNPRLVDEALRAFGPERVALGIDARAGRVRTHGWTEAAPMTAVELAGEWAARGMRWFIFTDVSRDGMSSGLNLEATVQLARAVSAHAIGAQATGAQATRTHVIASGGVCRLEDVRRAHAAGLSGVIIGRALYEGHVTLADALRVGRALAEEQNLFDTRCPKLVQNAAEILEQFLE